MSLANAYVFCSVLQSKQDLLLTGSFICWISCSFECMYCFTIAWRKLPKFGLHISWNYPYCVDSQTMSLCWLGLVLYLLLKSVVSRKSSRYLYIRHVQLREPG